MSKIKNIIHRIFKANFHRKIIKKQTDQLLEENKLLFERCRLLKEQNRFILYQLQRINEMMRYQLLGDPTIATHEMHQTRLSFDYQWHELPGGVAMPDDEKFMGEVTSLICQMTALPSDWFPGKQVVDIGCGAGRFTYGLLSLGACVTACDQSPWALQRTTALCQKFDTRFSAQQIDLLGWTQEATYELAFCFGVVHHTGNTYLAIRNAARKVKSGGHLFLMVYGFPEALDDLERFVEINSYESLRYKLRHVSLEEKKKTLIEMHGHYLGHGWFDAVSPQINDLLNFSEIVELLKRLGYQNIKRTRDNSNHYVIADKI
jgi:2-polyprenyl-3-methyl-5-hydroxy-6-metoxy-1,4-benzoquinol methylase